MRVNVRGVIEKGEIREKVRYMRKGERSVSKGEIYGKKCEKCEKIEICEKK